MVVLRCAPSTCLLPIRLSLPLNSFVRINDHPDMTSAVYHGRKTANQSADSKRAGKEQAQSTGKLPRMLES